jgi:uncharacterized membrane protein
MTLRDALLLIDALILLASIPLILQRVGPNRIFGLRTPRARANRAVWFRANLFYGWALATAALVSAGALWLAPQGFSDAPEGTSLILLPIAVAVVASLLYLRKLR